jgi:ribosomal-protein-alanine N-acetyltransferase
LNPLRIQSPRLDLIEVTPQLAQANLDDFAELARLLDVRIPAPWPPAHWDPAAIRWLMNKAQEQPRERGWFAWYVVLRGEGGPGAGGRSLIGTCGIKGPPDSRGVIEVGYGIVSEQHRRGFASEATTALINWALRDPRVKMVAAETFPHLIPSLGVMRKLGMTLLGDGSEPGVVQYGVTREAWSSPVH